MTAEKFDTYLFLTEETRSGSHTYFLYPVKVVDGKIRNFNTGRGSGNDPMYLADFRLSAYVDDGDKRQELRGLWGYTAEFRDVHSVSLENVGGMAKTLKTLAARVLRLYTKFGYHVTFGTFVSYYANAMKAKGIIVPRSNAWSYDEGSYQFLSLADGISVINRKDGELRVGNPAA